MSVTGTSVIAGPFSGDGITTAFAYPNYFIDPSDLVVELIDGSGNVTSQTLNVDYTVSGVLDADLNTYSGGGTVTMTAAPPVGYTLIISRRTAAKQELTLTALGKITSASLEVAHDRHTLTDQEFFSEYLGTLDGPPTVGTFAVGQWFKLRTAAPGGFAFYICTTAGSGAAAIWMGMCPISTTPWPGA